MSDSDIKSFNEALCRFLDESPTPFHAVSSIAQRLESTGFQRLQETDAWSLETGRRYYVTRNDSSIIAWTQGSAAISESGMRLIGAHTDSPCLKVKPNADIHRHGCWQIGVEVYGGALLNPWFDRDLSLAGRVHYKTNSGELVSTLVNFCCPVATIPSLAIHLDREANKKRSVNPQTHMPVLLAQSSGDGDHSLAGLLLDQVSDIDSTAKTILDYELSFYDTQKAEVIGVKGEYIASARLDNLLSCFIATQALCDASANGWNLMICSDHEEVGSSSAAGAAGPFLQQLLQRLSDSQETLVRASQKSTLISIDNAHALHPNYADKMDANHGPVINAGPVIKVNANQRYASNSETQAIFRDLCQLAEVPVQTFVVRSDMACGSTIGPITAAETGIKTLDVGLASYAMHSIRELAGSKDPYYLKQALDHFFLSER